MEVQSAYQNFTKLSYTSSLFSGPTKRISNFARTIANHPYPKVPSGIPISQSLFEFSLRSEVPLFIVFAYLIIIVWLNHRQDGKNRMKGQAWKAVLVIHNLLLAGFSLWTFKGAGSAAFEYFLRGYRAAGLSGFIHAFCDSPMFLWDKQLAFYTYWFYLSKFWEIFDTLIMIGKGRKASLLQEYHHAGAILTVWSGSRYESPAIWLFVVFNSFVHTIMYTYYAISVLRWPVPNFLKRSLTKIQITQFILGGSLATLTLMLRLPKLGELSGFDWKPLRGVDAFERFGGEHQEAACLATSGQTLAVLGAVGYLIPLTGLFALFYIQLYRRSSQIPAPVADSKAKASKRD